MNNIIKKPGKHFINLVIIILAISSFVFFVFGEYLKLAGYVMDILLIMLPYYLYSRSPKIQKLINLDFIELGQAILALVFFTSLLGSLGFYTNPQLWWYDTLIHFLNSIGLFLMAGYLIIIFETYFFKRQNVYLTLFISFVSLILFSFFWEFYEVLIDVIFTHASMFGQSGEKYYDTMTDLVADLIGGLVALWLIFRYVYGYIITNIKSN